MRASKVYKFLEDLKSRGIDLNRISVSIEQIDGGTFEAKHIGDLYDGKTNSILTDIVISVHKKYK